MLERVRQVIIYSGGVFRFHHIKNPMKRKTLVSEARDLRLGGGSKPGFPGKHVVHKW